MQLKHFEDCPIKRGYDLCTCDMLGEEIALVEWKVEEQEGRLHWWSFIAKLSIMGAPTIPRI